MKATLPDGTLFEGTPEEYLVIHRELGGGGNGHKTLSTSAVTSPWNEKRVSKFWNSLDIWNDGGRQRQLMEFLMTRDGKATEKEVWQHLGIKKGQELAGILANITRNARREAKDDDIKAVRWMLGEKQVGYYRIPDDLLQLLKKIDLHGSL